MARSPDIDLEHKPTETLLQNKRRASSARDKMSDVQENGIKPDRPKPDRPLRDGPVKAEKIAKSASGRETDFELIMGKASKAPTAKVRVQDLINYNVERKGQGRSDARPSDLHIPIARPKRQATEDGRTSFHFSHDSVAKTRSAVVSESGKVNRPGAAKAHNEYIERDSAVALVEDVAPAMADAGIDPLAEGLDSSLGPVSSDQSAVNDNDGVAVPSKEPYFDRPLSRSFLRAYRATLGSLLSDSDPDPRGIPTGPADGLRDVPGRGLVPDARDAEMLLWSNEVPVVGRDRTGGAGLRRAGDGDHEDRAGGGAGRLKPVPGRLSRVPETNTMKAAALLGGRVHVEPKADPTGPRPDPVHDHTTAEGEGRYIERQEALATQPDGTRVLFTNIDHRADRRAEFWRLVEEREREASPDRIAFTVQDNAAFWAAAAAHPKCPAKLSEALAVADPAKRLSIEVDDNVEMRRFLMSVPGWPDTGPKRRGETPDAYKERAGMAPCKFQDGRGGRVQYRIIGELPHELDVKGRASILKTFSEEFEKRNLPYVSVMHAPDHTNNDKNWHFHLVYYDRPCRRLTAEDIANTPADENPKNKVVEPVPQTAVGDWDFTVAEKYKTSSREIRERYPFAQEKVKEVSRQQDWIEKLRGTLADITNDHLQEGRVQRRVDPRRHSEMGIHSDPQEHLGTKLANLEAMGIATPRGVSNEERQWEAVQRKLEGDLERRKSVVDQQARKWIKQAERSPHLDDDARLKIRGNVTRWHQHRTEAEEHLAIAENLDQHMDRMLSRAHKVRDTCNKHLQAIGDGKTTKYQSSRADSLNRKSAEAVEWLTSATAMLQDEAKLSKDCRHTSDREMMIAEQLELVIARALLPTSIRQVADEAKKRDREEAELQREAARQRDETQKVQDDKRRALVKQEMDVWINAIRKSNRRLVQDGRRVVPMSMTPEDRSIVDAINYGAMATRLAGIKKAQDSVVADVVKAVREQPENIIRQRTDQGSSYVMVTSNRTLAKAFRTYADDPAVVAARDAAIKQVSEDAVRRAENRRIAAAEREASTATRTAPATDAPTRNERIDRPVAPRTPAERTDAETTAPRAGKAANAEGTKRAPRNDPNDGRPVDDGRSAAASERAVTREGLVRRNALNERIVRAVNAESMRLAVRDGFASLPDRHLKTIGVEASDLLNDDLQKRLVGIARTQEREIKRLTAYVRKMPDRLVERNGQITVSAKAPQEIVEFARRWQGEEAVDLTLRTIREETRRGVQQPSPERVREPSPVDPQRDRAETPGEAQNPAPATDPVRDRTAPEPEAREPAPAPVAAPAEEPTRPRFTEVEPDYEMRAQAKAYMEEQERLRKQAAAPTRTTIEQRTGEDPVSRAVRIATEKAATSGAHPLIDQWIQGVRENMPVEDRRQVALRITSERAAREKLRDIDRTVARRIRDDADHARDQQQPGLGFEMDRGVTPKR